MGMVMGIFMASFEHQQPIAVGGPGAPPPPKVPLRQQIKQMADVMGQRSVMWGKNFAVVGGVYSTVECFIEQTRGQHDLKNSVSAGCVTGAALSRKSGWQGMCMGCAGFAAFSVVIDAVMGE